MDYHSADVFERLDAYFRDWDLPTTKDDVLRQIDGKISRVQNKQVLADRTDSYRHRYIAILERFKSQINLTDFFQELEEYWHYEFRIDEFGAKLNLIYVSDVEFEDFDEDGEPRGVNPSESTTFTLITTAAKMLTVEEFAAANEVTVTTVRQWIRRGKIRAVIKNGNTWMISELAEVSGRGYQSGFYHWSCRLEDLPKEYEFLNESKYSAVDIRQNDEKKDMFDIICWPEQATYQMTVKEKERFELYLLGHPLIETHTHDIF